MRVKVKKSGVKISKVNQKSNFRAVCRCQSIQFLRFQTLITSCNAKTRSRAPKTNGWGRNIPWALAP